MYYPVHISMFSDKISVVDESTLTLKQIKSKDLIDIILDGELKPNVCDKLKMHGCDMDSIRNNRDKLDVVVSYAVTDVDVSYKAPCYLIVTISEMRSGWRYAKYKLHNEYVDVTYNGGMVFIYYRGTGFVLSNIESIVCLYRENDELILETNKNNGFTDKIRFDSIIDKCAPYKDIILYKDCALVEFKRRCLLY